MQLHKLTSMLYSILAQGIVRLNHLQLCVSHQAILSKMDEMAAGFEQRIQQWKECLVKELLRKRM